ncbi:MAG: hypothetical protein Q4G22_15310 [Paracoccus sp. (in: a-proteobacteria)]|uniref:hypothetical protein n=1 Tax=Paracoccus sp. TaxID=267 RepID=UPI0026E09B90|nr:hypothetical protein [Paracoccus sp. (in: a-proteobacteria)]MDO5633181.1 hypothetical protein [Paracoccus sp. (in: a-proteobacteria)]
MPQRIARTPARRLSRHLLALFVLLAAGIAQATFQGGLWPFDLRFSVLMTAGWLAVLAAAWWPVALILAAASALAPCARWRLALWPAALLLMTLVHGLWGARLGFVPAPRLGADGFLRLYTIPTALPLLAGSVLHTAIPAIFPERRTT